jgi:hypothetical protein
MMGGMDKHWIEACQREGHWVGVVSGQIAAEINPTTNAPMIQPALVRGEADRPGTWWVEIEFLAGEERLPQMYREEEILGLWPRQLDGLKERPSSS